MVTIGANAIPPNTGLGYARMSDLLEDVPGVCKAVRCIENPPRNKTEAMLAEGSHAWNAGVFLTRACRYREELAIHAPVNAPPRAPHTGRG